MDWGYKATCSTHRKDVSFAYPWLHVFERTLVGTVASFAETLIAGAPVDTTEVSNSHWLDSNILKVPPNKWKGGGCLRW